MEIAGLYEMDSRGEHFTWSNNQSENPIYSMINRLIGNMDWLHQHMDYTLTVMPPNVSYRDLLCLKKNKDDRRKRRTNFKYTNNIAEMDGFVTNVNRIWSKPVYGRPMNVVWKKLKRFQPMIKKMAKPLADNHDNIKQARQDLSQTQMQLEADRMNPSRISKVRKCNDDLVGWQEIEETVLRQRAKLNWMRWGDGNKKYFHATIKSRKNSNGIHTLQIESGVVLKDVVNIEEEVLKFYEKLMATADRVRNDIDVSVMREGPQLNNDQHKTLIAPVTEQEVVNALKNIDDLKSPGIDGYGAYFFKKAWTVVRNDVLNSVDDLFLNERIFKEAKCTLVSLIPKNKEASMIKEYRPIS